MFRPANQYAGLSFSTLLLLTACEAKVELGSTTADGGAEVTVDTTPTGQVEEAKAAAMKARLTREQIRALYSDASCPTEGGIGPVTPFAENGLRAKARVPVQAVSSFNSAQREDWRSGLARYLQADSEVVPNTIFFNQLNVPTRKFDLGFPLLAGGVLENRHGEAVHEYFRLDFQGRLGLPAGKAAGDYEIAILSDDGVRLKLNGQTYLEHETHTDTRLVCGNSSVQLAAGQRLKLDLEYFQGPRYDIALVALWRPAQATRDPDCGYHNWKGWFDNSTVPSTPKQRYLDLLARGWEVIPPEAFSLPEDERSPTGDVTNPCTDPDIREEFENNPI